MQELFGKALEKAENLIKNHHDQYQQLVDSLLKKETLEGSEVEEIVWGNKTNLSEKIVYIVIENQVLAPGFFCLRLIISWFFNLVEH